MSPLVCMRPCDLHSLRCKQCFAWLDFMASRTAMTETLTTATLTSQLPCGIPCYADLSPDKTCSSLPVSTESDGFASR